MKTCDFCKLAVKQEELFDHLKDCQGQTPATPGQVLFGMKQPPKEIPDLLRNSGLGSKQTHSQRFGLQERHDKCSRCKTRTALDGLPHCVECLAKSESEEETHD